jgi:hypothetical protein
VAWSLSLFPLLVARNCRSCKVRETFFLDKWNRKKGAAVRKTFELDTKKRQTRSSRI